MQSEKEGGNKVSKTYLCSTTASKESQRVSTQLSSRVYQIPNEKHHAVLHKKFLKTCVKPTLAAISKQINHYYNTSSFHDTLWQALTEDDTQPFIKLLHVDPTYATLRGIVDTNGRTPAHVACKDGCHKILGTILDVHVKNQTYCKWLSLQSHRSLLHYAVIGGQLTIVELLYHHYYRGGTGSFQWFEELHRETQSGNTPLDLAREYDWYNIQHFLLREMATFAVARAQWQERVQGMHVKERHHREMLEFQWTSSVSYFLIVEEEWRLCHPFKEKKEKINLLYRLMKEKDSAAVVVVPSSSDVEEHKKLDEPTSVVPIRGEFIAEQDVSSWNGLSTTPRRHPRAEGRSEEEIRGQRRDVLACGIRPVFAVRDRVKELLQLRENEHLAERLGLEGDNQPKVTNPRAGSLFAYLGLELSDGVHYRTFARAPPRIRVVHVIPGGAAEEGKIPVGAMISEVQGTSVTDLQSLRDVLMRIPPMTPTVSVMYQVDGIQTTVSLRPRTTDAIPTQKSVRRTRSPV